jgi:CheY-like chemotaxis protein
VDGPSRHSGKVSKQVLVVDDDDSIRNAIREVLTDEGYSVTTAPNGEAALGRLRDSDRPPGLILLDLMMPVMDGWQFLDRLSTDPQLHQVPVVVLSANTGGPARGDVILYLRKPIDLDRLVETVDRWCADGP